MSQPEVPMARSGMRVLCQQESVHDSDVVNVSPPLDVFDRNLERAGLEEGLDEPGVI